MGCGKVAMGARFLGRPSLPRLAGRPLAFFVTKAGLWHNVAPSVYPPRLRSGFECYRDFSPINLTALPSRTCSCHLFISERYRRLDAHGPTSRKVTGERTCREQYGRCQADGCDICWLY